MQNKTKEKIWFLFCFTIIISCMKYTWCSKLNGILLILFQIILLIDYFRENDFKLIFNNMFIISFVIMMIIFSISMFFSFNKLDSLIKIVKIVDFIICTNLLLPNFLKTLDLKKIFSIIIVALFMVLVFNLIFFRNDYIITYFTGRVGNPFRLLAGFSHPNILAYFTYLLALSSMAYMMLIKKIKLKLLIPLAIGIYGTIKSDSRTAIYCIEIFVLLYILISIISKFKEKKFLFKVFIILGIVAIFTFFNLASYEKLNKLSSNRLQYAENIILELKSSKRMLFGVGAVNKLSNEDYLYTDTAYIYFIYQFGLISVIPLLLFLFNYFVFISKISDSNLKKILYPFLIVFYLYCFFEDILFNLTNLLSIFTYAIIMTIYYKEVENNDKKGINNLSSL